MQYSLLDLEDNNSNSLTFLLDNVQIGPKQSSKPKMTQLNLTHSYIVDKQRQV